MRKLAVVIAKALALLALAALIGRNMSGRDHLPCTSIEVCQSSCLNCIGSMLPVEWHVYNQSMLCCIDDIILIAQS